MQEIKGKQSMSFAYIATPKAEEETQPAWALDSSTPAQPPLGVMGSSPFPLSPPA